MLKYLEKLWVKYPDFRLGQLIWMIADDKDPFFFEMDHFLRFCESKDIKINWDEIPEYFVGINPWERVLSEWK